MKVASRAVLALLCTILLASAGSAAGNWKTEIEQAAALPPLQAVVALARMTPQEPAAREEQSRQYAAALQRLGAERSRSLGPQMDAIHQARIGPAPHGTPQVASTDAWRAPLYPSPDGQLVAFRTDDGLEVRTSGGDLVLRCQPPAELQQHMPVRFSAVRRQFGIPAWAHDGVQIACPVQGVMCVFPIGGSARVVSEVQDMSRAADSAEGLWDGDPIWSGDDRHLLFTRWVRDAKGRLLEPRTVLGSAGHAEVLMGQGNGLGFYRGDTTRAVCQFGGTLSILSGDLNNTPHVATGVITGALSEDGRNMVVAHVGRIGVMDTKQWQEHVFAIPDGAGECAQPPQWVSANQVALTLGTRDQKGRHYGVWLLNTEKGQFTRLCDGYLLPWAQRPDAIAASPGLLHLVYH